MLFYEKENEFLKNSEFCDTWFIDHIESVFQISEWSYQYSMRIDKLDPIEIALGCFVSYLPSICI